MFHDGIAVVMLGCGWRGQGGFLNFEGEPRREMLGFLACLAIRERGVPLF
jgi:hypothetical protein